MFRLRYRACRAQRGARLRLWEGEGQWAPKCAGGAACPVLHWFSNIVPSSVQPCLEATGCVGEGFGVQVSWSPTFTQEKPPNPSLHPFYYWRPAWQEGGSYLTLFKCVRQTEGLQTRWTLTWQGVGKGRAPACLAFPTLSVLPLSQAQGTLKSSPQGHCVPSEVKELSEL